MSLRKGDLLSQMLFEKQTNLKFFRLIFSESATWEKVACVFRREQLVRETNELLTKVPARHFEFLSYIITCSIRQLKGKRY